MTRISLTRICRLPLAALAIALLALPVYSVAATPSFDCAKAGSSAEKAVCGSEDLAALDRETARLYRLATKGPHMTAERLTHLKAVQRGWIKGRDDCWKFGDGLEPCIAQEYVSRIHSLRESYADARYNDASGTSLGPFLYVCTGLQAGLSAVFVNGDTAKYVSLKWTTHAIALPQAVSGSGARYVGSNFEGEFTFWVKGQNASFSRPDEPALTCSVEEAG